MHALDGSRVGANAEGVAIEAVAGADGDAKRLDVVIPAGERRGLVALRVGACPPACRDRWKQPLANMADVELDEIVLRPRLVTPIMNSLLRLCSFSTTPLTGLMSSRVSPAPGTAWCCCRASTSAHRSDAARGAVIALFREAPPRQR